VPLGIIQHNENELESMCKILEHLYNYIPKHCDTETVFLENGQPVEYEKYQLHPMILAGDQLTSARIRGAQASRSHGDNSLEKLDGFVPATMDWHSQAIL